MVIDQTPQATPLRGKDIAVGRADAVLFALALHILDLIPIGILGYIYLSSKSHRSPAPLNV
jgi:hypothetical protein